MAILTKEEEIEVKRVWSVCAKDLKGVGMRFFIYFFKKYPHYQKVFKGFADVPLDQLLGNVRLTAHAFTVMAGIGGLIYNLEDPTILNELLHRTGRNHSKRNLKPEDFDNLKNALIEYFGQSLGEQFTAASKAAWTKLLTHMMGKICEGVAAGERE